jgi:transcriptional regulator with XRE-family HTH domain
MLTKTLSEGLGRYQIGPKLRTLRLKKKMGLVELGRHTGLSAALLSKVERGRLFPTLPTLLRVSLVFGVGLEHFFTNDARPGGVVVRKKDRLRFPERPNATEPAYTFECLDFPATERPISGYLVDFRTRVAASKPHRHAGVELIYLMSGGLEVDVDGEEHLLEAGDSMYFDSTRPHSYRRRSGARCSAVVVTTEPGLSRPS